jgi:predicted RNase H-like HicB family nuclease
MEINSMQRYLVEIFWSQEDDGYIATVPDLPGCCAWGATAFEALRETQDAIAAWIEACEKSGEPVPMPTTKARQAA